MSAPFLLVPVLRTVPLLLTVPAHIREYEKEKQRVKTYDYKWNAHQPK